MSFGPPTQRQANGELTPDHQRLPRVPFHNLQTRRPPVALATATPLPPPPQVIKANDDLTPEHHQFFLYQLLRGLKYIHSGAPQGVGATGGQGGCCFARLLAAGGLKYMHSGAPRAAHAPHPLAPAAMVFRRDLKPKTTPANSARPRDLQPSQPHLPPPH